MKIRYLAGLALTVAIAPPLAAKEPGNAIAATPDSLAQTLTPGTSRTLRFTRAVKRIEVDKEGVISVRATNARAIQITAIAPGNALVAAYGADGELLGSGTISVNMSTSVTSAALASDPRMRQVKARRNDEGGGRTVGGGAQAASATVLSGSVDSLEDRIEAQRLAAETGEGPVVNYVRVNGEQMVAVDVQFVAVSSSTLKSLGFNFSKLSGDIQGAVVAPSTLSSYNFSSSGLSLTAAAPLQSAFNLFLGSASHGLGAVMSALASTGLSQLLAQPTLLVRSGEEAHFLAGGEIPIPVPQGFSGAGGGAVTIQFKEFGVRLSVAPTVLGDGRISMKIAPEVSELDYANGVQIQGFTVPGIRRRSADTTVQLGSGQSFVIAGLSYTNNTTTKQKVPFLGDLPILGAFFKNQSTDKERQELIIVATPRLVSPLKAETAAAMTARITGDAPDLSFKDMILGSNDADKEAAAFGVVRR